MKQSWTAYIRFFFIARARAYARVQAWAAIFAVVVCSSGLIHSKENPTLKHIRNNQEFAHKNPTEAEFKLIETLETNSDPIVRQSAAQLLGNHCQNLTVVSVLANALQKDSDKAVRCACALSLGLSPTFRAITALERSSDDRDPDLRRQIAFSLKRHRVGANKIRAESLLKKMQKDDDVSVRMMAGAKR